MKLFVLTGFLIALVLAIPQVLAQVYKWVDEHGKTQYTDRPPPPGVATEKKRFNTKGGTPSSSGASGRNQPQSLSEAREALDKRQVERKEEQSKQQSKAEEDKKKCIEAQTRLRMYTDILGKTLRTGPAPALVISHENMTSCAVAGSPFMRLLERGVVLTLDEAHRDKGAKTKRGRATRDCVKVVHAGKGEVWPMTATPMPASPLDLWVLLTWVGLAEHCFSGGGNDPLYNFIRHFGGGVCQWTKRWVFPAHVPGGPVTQLQGLALRRRRADVLPELPPKRYQLHLVEVEGATRRMLDNVTEAAAYACGMSPNDIDKVTDIDQFSLPSRVGPRVR